MTHTITGPQAAKQAGIRARSTGRTRPRGARSAWAVALALLGPGAWSGAAQAGDSGPAATAWAASPHAKARLIAGGRSGPGFPSHLAGVEIVLDPGFITYWRDPGEAGVPPRFDTSASQNVATVTVDYPAPRRLDEGGALAYGYAGAVTFPLHVTPADPARPAVLALDLDYAVCGTLCLPAAAHLRLSLPAGPGPEVAGPLQAALGAVPRPANVGAPGPLAVIGIAPADKGFAVSTRAGAGAGLFVEPPEGWVLQPDAGTPKGADRVDFHVAVLQKPEGAAPDALDLRLTLVDGSGAIEVPVRVKAPAPLP